MGISGPVMSLNACPSCAREIPADSRVCPYCANPVPPAGVIPTVTAPPKLAEASYHSGFGSSSSDSIDNARFTPGTMLADRYRIVGLLGKGGMGEVYRADDLKLRQPVALKFLPEALSQDPKKLERFLHEVRVARQVSHPNVCRVYDISEADGQHFISMEYVDGEDLAAVLRRLGRPSKEKALQIARQLCAGLAAAHDKGVLHRDLKPHNVMIDGQGRVRITDFGLAGFAGDFIGKEVYAGTPAWSVFLLVPLRYGLLASVFFWFFSGQIVGLPMMFGLSGWQSEASWTAIIFITVVAVYGFHTALAGRPIFRDELSQP